MKKVSFQDDFVVQPTIGKAAEGEDSLLSVNNRIQAAKDTKDVFLLMKRLCAAAAVQRKIISKFGSPNPFSKVRDDPEDFLNFCALHYTERWKKQKEGQLRAPSKPIQNWIPYILSTIRFHLIEYNKQVYDYDFLPLPRLLDDPTDTDDSSERDFPDENSLDAEQLLAFQELSSVKNIDYLLFGLPAEFYPYFVDILYYIRTKGGILYPASRNFVIVGCRLLYKEVEQWMM